LSGRDHKAQRTDSLDCCSLRCCHTGGTLRCAPGRRRRRYLFVKANGLTIE
jgi:hypothetical protein